MINDPHRGSEAHESRVPSPEPVEVPMHVLIFGKDT
jgi:hypothetical protein